eukprot:SAG11_NODE_4_length_33019_cov_28.098909_15_plen_389_part_00
MDNLQLQLTGRHSWQCLRLCDPRWRTQRRCSTRPRSEPLWRMQCAMCRCFVRNRCLSVQTMRALMDAALARNETARPRAKPEPAAGLLSDGQHRSFAEEGWLHLRGVLRGAALQNLQKECARVEAATKAEWLGHVRAGTAPVHHQGNPADGYGPTHHVVLPVMAKGNIFPELLGHPAIVSVLVRFMGPDIAMSDNALCVKPAGTESHVGWHRDSTSWTYAAADDWSAVRPSSLLTVASTTPLRHPLCTLASVARDGRWPASICAHRLFRLRCAWAGGPEGVGGERLERAACSDGEDQGDDPRRGHRRRDRSVFCRTGHACAVSRAGVQRRSRGRAHCSRRVRSGGPSRRDARASEPDGQGWRCALLEWRDLCVAPARCIASVARISSA